MLPCNNKVITMNKPIVSVVMPAYRCAATIRSAIESVLLQDVPLELLIIDDCSPEDITGTLAQFSGDARVRLFRNKENLGAAQSRNRGVALAEGKYIAFLDADDQWEPGKLRRQLAMLEQTGAVLCCTARELMTPEGDLTGRVIPVKETITYRDLLRHNSINCSSVLIRREAAVEFPMRCEQSHEDYIMWLEVLEKYGFACGINKPLLKYRLSSTGKSGSKLHSAKMTFMVYRHMGFGLVKSVVLFASYALHGVVKYAVSYFGGKHDA